MFPKIKREIEKLEEFAKKEKEVEKGYGICGFNEKYIRNLLNILAKLGFESYFDRGKSLGGPPYWYIIAETKNAKIEILKYDSIEVGYKSLRITKKYINGIEPEEIKKEFDKKDIEKILKFCLV